jgi:hypothetical protein
MSAVKIMPSSGLDDRRALIGAELFAEMGDRGDRSVLKADHLTWDAFCPQSAKIGDRARLSLPKISARE